MGRIIYGRGKSILWFVLIAINVVLFVHFGVVNVFAADLTEGIYTYTVTDNAVTITDCDDTVEGIIVVPATIDGMPVVEISKFAFAECDGITELDLSACTSLTTIKGNAFQNSDVMTSIVLPSSLTTIEDRAFAYCRVLESMDLNVCSNLESIGTNIFAEDYKLTEVKLSSNMEMIPENMFQYCKALVRVEGMENIKVIGDYAFYGCDMYKPDFSTWSSLEEIGKNAFYNCDSMISVVMPKGVKVLGESAFENCSALESVDLSACTNLTVITARLFAYCENLSSVTMPTSIEGIDTRAFANSGLVNINLADLASLKKIDEAAFNYTKLTSMALPANVNYIGAKAFGTNASLKKVDLSKLNGTDLTLLNEIFEKSAIEEIIFSNSMKYISEGMFSGCTMLQNIQLPDSLTEIGKYAFRETKIENLELPDYIEKIDEGAFIDIKTMTSVKLPKFLSDLGVDAFSGDTALVDITWPDNKAFTVVRGFKGCSNIKSSVLEALPASVVEIGENAFASNNWTEITIPDRVQKISKNAFSDAKNLTTVHFSDAGNLVSLSGFAGCKALPANFIETIPESVVEFGDEAFYNLSQLTTIVLSENVKTVGEKAFSGLSNVKNLELPSSLRSVGKEGFAYLRGLDELIIHEGVQRIGESAFFYAGANGALEEVILPISLNSIGMSSFRNVGNAEHRVEIYFKNADIIGEADGSGDFYYNQMRYSGGLFNYSYVTVHAYRFDSNGNESFLYSYMKKYMDNQYYTYDNVTFEEMQGTQSEYYMISGTVPSEAKVMVTIGDKDRRKAGIGENGSFRISAPANSKVVVAVSIDGYNTQYFMKEDYEFVEDWELDEISKTSFTPCDYTNNMSVKLTLDGNKMSGYTLNDFNIELSNGGAVYQIGEDYSVSDYGILLLNPSILANSALTLTLTPVGNESFEAASCTATRKNGEFLINFTSWGHAKISVSSNYAGQETIVVYDEAGKLVFDGAYSNGVYDTGKLKNGNYTVVVYNANEYFDIVEEFEDFKKLGLVENVDYVKKAIVISDGTETNVTVVVPILDTKKFKKMLDAQACYIVVSDSIIAGHESVAKLYYKLEDEKGGTITIKFPAQAFVKQVYTDKKVLEISENATEVDVKVEDLQGCIFVNYVLEAAGDYTISANYSKDDYFTAMTHRNIRVLDIAMKADNNTSAANKGKVTIYTTPRTDVTLYVGENRTKYQATTNAVGKVNVEYDFENPYEGKKYELVASTNESTCTTYTYYSSNNVYNLTAYQGGNKIDIVKNGVSDQNPYTYVSTGEEKYEYWTFKADVKAKQILEDRAVLVLTMLDGSEQEVILKKNGVSEAADGEQLYTFAGNVQLSQLGNHVFAAALIPCGFSVITAVAEADSTLSYVMKNDEFEGIYQKVVDKGEENNEAVDFNALIFNYKSLTKNSSFGNLDETIKQAILEFEEKRIGFLEGYSDFLGLDERVDSYAGWLEVLEKEKGITFDRSDILANCDVEQLKMDGYEVDEKYSIAYKRSTENDEIYAKIIGTTGSVVIRYSKDEKEQSFENDYIAFHNSCMELMDAGQSLCGSFEEYATKEDATEEIKNVCLEMSNVATNAINVGNYYLKNDGMNAEYVEVLKYLEDIEDYGKTLLTMQKNIIITNTQSSCGQQLGRELAATQNLIVATKEQADELLRKMLMAAIMDIVNMDSFTEVDDTSKIILQVANAYVDSCEEKEHASGVMCASNKVEWITRTRNEICTGDEIGNSIDVDDELVLHYTIVVNQKKVIIDPSGIVYEAFESNPIEGVTATIYYSEKEDGSNAVIWDANEYDQMNPQLTGKDGAYAWDVPMGYWQVRFEKDGYIPTSTDWLPVPPAQIGLKTPMVSSKAPTVQAVYAYKNYVSVKFSQYMKADEAVSVDGFEAKWVFASEDEKSAKVSKELLLYYMDGKKLGDNVSFTLSGLFNYAGTELETYSSTDELNIVETPADLECNYSEKIVVEADSENNKISVRLVDADGNDIKAAKVYAKLENSEYGTIETGNDETYAVTNEDGLANFLFTPSLAGRTEIIFTVGKTDFVKRIPIVITTDASKAERPVLSIAGNTFDASAPKENNVTVAVGELLTITKASEDYVVYYTLDNTCPCENSASRHIYEGPIEITENTYIRVAAYKPGMDYSNRINLTITVKAVDDKTDDKVDDKTDDKVDDKTDDKVDDKTDDKVDDKADNKVDDKTDDKVDEKTDDKTGGIAPSDNVDKTTETASTVVKKKQKITIAKLKTIKAASLKKKAVKINLKAKTDGKGKLTYKVAKYPKNARKCISVSKKGVVTLKKGAKKGTYKIAITAAAKGKYKLTTKSVSIKVK